VLQKGVGVRVPPLAPWKGRIVGLVRRFAKPLRVEMPFEGSNPSPSATEEPAARRVPSFPGIYADNRSASKCPWAVRQLCQVVDIGAYLSHANLVVVSHLPQ
jgi:hypothetical protein